MRVILNSKRDVVGVVMKCREKNHVRVIWEWNEKEFKKYIRDMKYSLITFRHIDHDNKVRR